MKKILVSLFLLAALTFTPSAFAGGGPVALMAFPLRPFDETKIFILQADVYTNQPCNQIQPNFTFKDGVDGDSITTFTSRNDPTYITRHYFTGYPSNTWREVCTTYAQVKSGVAKQRTAVVSVDVNGKTETRETPVSFGDDPLSKQLQSFGRVNDYDNTPHPDVISEKYIGNDKREVDIQWQKISWAAKYFLMAYVVKNDGAISSPFEIITTENTKATVTLPASSDLKLLMNACRTGDPCTSIKDETYSLLLSKMYNTNQPKVTPTTAVTKTTPAPTNITEQPVVIPTASEDKKIEELNKKIADLEGKLEQSQEKQSVLEQRINDLVNFIKRLFPFFK